MKVLSVSFRRRAGHPGTAIVGSYPCPLKASAFNGTPSPWCQYQGLSSAQPGFTDGCPVPGTLVSTERLGSDGYLDSPAFDSGLGRFLAVPKQVF